MSPSLDNIYEIGQLISVLSQQNIAPGRLEYLKVISTAY